MGGPGTTPVTDNPGTTPGTIIPPTNPFAPLDPGQSSPVGYTPPGQGWTQPGDPILPSGGVDGQTAPDGSKPGRVWSTAAGAWVTPQMYLRESENPDAATVSPVYQQILDLVNAQQAAKDPNALTYMQKKALRNASYNDSDY